MPVCGRDSSGEVTYVTDWPLSANEAIMRSLRVDSAWWTVHGGSLVGEAQFYGAPPCSIAGRLQRAAIDAPAGRPFGQLDPSARNADARSGRTSSDPGDGADPPPRPAPPTAAGQSETLPLG